VKILTEFYDDCQRFWSLHPELQYLSHNHSELDESKRNMKTDKESDYRALCMYESSGLFSCEIGKNTALSSSSSDWPKLPQKKSTPTPFNALFTTPHLIYARIHASLDLGEPRNHHNGR